MSQLKKMTIHSSKYFSLQVLAVGISMITFPIFTRLFSVAEYGLFALANTTVSILLAFSKCGITTAFARDYPSYQHENPKTLYASSFWIQVQSAIALTSVYIFAVLLLRDYFPALTIKVFLIIGPLLILRTLEALLLGFFRAEERINSFNMVSLAFKVGMSLGGVAGALLLREKIIGFFVGSIILESLLVFFFINTRRENFSFSDYSRNIGAGLLKYGAPLIIFEISSLIISYADRYQIQYYLGEESLGIYSVGYNLSTYAQNLITTPLWMAIFPIYTKMWHNDGKEKTSEFLTSCLKYYFILAIPVIFGMSYVGGDTIHLLATEKFSAASAVLPWILAALLIYGMYHIVAAGLYLNKKTKSVAVATAVCAAFNVLLNMFLIPRYGISGAAYSTFIAYIALIIIITIMSFNFLHVKIPFVNIFAYILFSVLMVFIMSLITLQSPVQRLLSMVLLGMASYSAMIFLYDAHIRSFILNFLMKKTTS